MAIKSNILEKISTAFAVGIFLLTQIDSFSQKKMEIDISESKSKFKMIHSVSIYLKNSAYKPEKIYDIKGLLGRIPQSRYGFELGINYTPLLYKSFGMYIDLNFGMLPDGQKTTSNNQIKNDTVWQNGFIGDPNIAPFENGFGLYYWGFNTGITYLIRLHKMLVIQPKLGISLLQYFSYYNSGVKVFCDSEQLYCNDFYKHYYDNNPNSTSTKRNFFPDVQLGFNFLVCPINTKHYIKLGVFFNYSFTNRLEGEYQFYNLGEKYNSSGKVIYSSTHGGVSIGYQFLSKPIEGKSKRANNYLLNPRF